MPDQLPLSALLSKVLIGFTLEFDRELNLARGAARSEERAPSLAMWSNVLRFVQERGIDERRLPGLSGVSKPVIRSMIATLERHSWVVVGAAPNDRRAKMVRMTPRGRTLSTKWQRVLAEVEERWGRQFGEDAIERLRGSLETVAAQLDAGLPHYPMAMSHRGGTPTGA